MKMNKKKKYLFCVFGTSNGDLGPCLAIARELVRRGHSVAVASHESYREMIAEQGIGFIGTLPAMNREEGVRWFEYAAQSNVKEWRHLARLVTHHAETNVTRLLKDADFDIILCNQGNFFAPILAEKLGIPWGMIFYQPIAIVPEFSLSMIFFRTWSFGSLRRIIISKPISKVIYFFSLFVIFLWMRPLKLTRKSLGLPPPPGGLSFGKSLLSSPHFNIALYSPCFSKLRSDYPQPIISSGFLREQCNNKPITSRTSQFLENGDSPLLFSFGTFAAATALGKKLLNTAVETCVSTNNRAVFIIGKFKIRDLFEEQLGEQFIVREYEPFPVLLPQVSLIVHIGGMGTVTAALRAGVPQLILPFTYEQCDNALRLQNMGLARTLSVARCNLSSLAREIELTSADSYRKRAAEVRAMIEEEDGATNVADYLERLP